MWKNGRAGTIPFLFLFVRYEEKLPSIEVIGKEIELIYATVKDYTPNSVFCHNDLLCANFILNEYNGKITLNLKINLNWS